MTVRDALRVAPLSIREATTFLEREWKTVEWSLMAKWLAPSR